MKLVLSREQFVGKIRPCLAELVLARLGEGVLPLA